MKPFLFLFYLQMIYTSHTLLKLLTRTPHRHHWYFPNSVVTELHPFPHASPSSTHSSMSAIDPPMVRAYSSSPSTNERERCSSTPHTNAGSRSPLMLAKPISPQTSLIRHSHVVSETLLSNPPSTIPDPPKTDLVAVAEDRCRH